MCNTVLTHLSRVQATESVAMMQVGSQIFMKPENNILTLQAIFQSARTTIDGGIRLSFDIDASQAEIIPVLLQWRDKGLNVAITPDDEPEVISKPFKAF